MRIEDLLRRSSYTLLAGDLGGEATSLIYDSRKVTPGSMFVCLPGAVTDGHLFADQALEDGAAAVIVQEDHWEKLRKDGFLQRANEKKALILSTVNTRRTLAELSAAWFDYPAEKIPVVGVTGTKGKTTTTYMIQSMMQRAGRKAGLIGTIEIDDGENKTPALNTTPESYLIEESLARMVENGCDLCVMEVSSQALMQGRTAGIRFAIGVFTNLEPDHIGPNEHRDFEDYLHCKARLFRQCEHAIVNADDSHTEEILKESTCKTLERISARNKADFYAENIHCVYEPGYLGVSYDLKGEMEFPVSLDIPGEFTVYNSLVAIAVAHHFGVEQEAMREALSGIRVKGRVEIVDTPGPYTLMIDYAHNAMALRSLLTSLRQYEPSRLVCLFGCGGDRAKARRFEMGEVSGELADLSILTSDNPRTEDPEAILNDIQTGIDPTGGKYERIADRREAIRYVLENAQSGDVIVLAGKGHEDYQEIMGKKYPMDERVIVAELLREL